MIRGFEVFDMRAWMEDGLTVLSEVVHETAKKIVRRKGAWKIVASVAIMASAIPAFSTLGTPEVFRAPTVDLRVTPLTSTAGDVPVGYWPKLMVAMDKWKPSRADEISCDVDAFI